MNQPEQASLQSLHDLEYLPSPRVWQQINLEWERGSLCDQLDVLAEQPNPTHWNDLNPNLPNRKRHSLYLAAACIFLMIGIGYTFFKPTSSKIQIESIALVPVEKEKTERSTIPATTAQIVIPGWNESGTLIEQKAKKSSPQPDKDYLWLASKSGAPIRIHTRWSDLSCCLSGEIQAADCQLQQQQWHREIEASNLGFQADPLLGLIELLDNAANPSTISPILWP